MAELGDSLSTAGHESCQHPLSFPEVALAGCSVPCPWGLSPALESLCLHGFQSSPTYPVSSLAAFNGFVSGFHQFDYDYLGVNFFDFILFRVCLPS